MSADGAMLLLEGYLQKRKDTMVRFSNGLGGVQLRSPRARPRLSLSWLTPLCRPLTEDEMGDLLVQAP